MATDGIGSTDIEGLPAEYEGLLCLASPDAPSGNYLPMDEVIDPSSLAFPEGSETLWAFVWPKSQRYDTCGYFTFGVVADEIMAETVDVLPGHERKGVATAVYRFVQRATDMRVVPSNSLSPEGKALWVNLRGILDDDWTETHPDLAERNAS